MVDNWEDAIKVGVERLVWYGDINNTYFLCQPFT